MAKPKLISTLVLIHAVSGTLVWEFGIKAGIEKNKAYRGTVVEVYRTRNGTALGGPAAEPRRPLPIHPLAS